MWDGGVLSPLAQIGEGVMRSMVLAAVLFLAVSPLAAAQQAADTSRPDHPAFHLDLQPLFVPGYEAGRELRLALWDSPMSRLELAVAREQWALRNVGPMGAVVPFQQFVIPQRLDFATGAQRLVLGPWSRDWNRLTWQEKLAAGAETGLLALVLVEMVRHVR